jgi:hypothetical protein
MPRPKWKTNLVNAFPIPDDRKPKKSQATEDSTEDDDPNAFKRQGIFPFLSLPSELRYKIYNLLLFSHPDPVASSDPYNHELLPTLRTLSLLLVNHRIHAEATHLLYSSTTFRLFPLQDFLYLPTPSDLAPHYRSHITRLTLTLGASWTAPPANWRVSKGLARCLSRLKLVRTLRILVQLDPSQPMFEKYRVSYAFFTDFCGELLRDVLKAMPKLETVELAGYSNVEPDGPLVSRLRLEAEQKGKAIRWSRESGWYARMVEGKLKPIQPVDDEEVELMRKLGIYE